MDYRDATHMDVMDILEMWESMYKEIGQPIDDEHRFYMHFSIMERILDPHWMLYVASDNRKVWGFIMVQVKNKDYSKEPMAHCEALYVKKPERGKGTAERLESKALAELKVNNIKHIEFTTIYDESLIKIRQRQGYKPIKVIYSKEA